MPLSGVQIIRRRAGRILQWIRAGCLLLPLAAGMTVQEVRAASFSATLEPDTVAVGDTAALKLEFVGSGQIQVSPPPSLPGLVISGPQQGHSINTVNGRVTETVSVTYFLRPTRTNVFTIPPLRARVAGEEFQSAALRLTAVAPTQSASAQSLALLRLVVPRERLYVGENVVVELQLLLDRNVSDPSQFSMPDFSGNGWFAGQPQQGKPRQVQVGSQIMTLIPIQIPLRPLAPGTLTLGPVESSVVVQVPAQPRRNDPFGGLGIGFFQRTAPQRVPLALPAHSVEVLPLPRADVPASFAGAVGHFEMTVTAGPTNVTVGDPITLRVQVAGTGNLGSIALPEPLVGGDFKTYEPETKLDTTDEFGFTGMKTIEQIVIPENTEVRELPPVEFSYFDPEAGAYRTLAHPAIPLTVMPAGSRPTPQIVVGSPQGADQSSRQDIVHIKHTLGSLDEHPGAGSFTGSFYVWNGVPVLAWAGVVVWRKRREALGRDPRLRRRREVRRVVTEGLRSLEQDLAEGDSKAFFSTVFRLLQEQIGLALDQPASGITGSVVDERLARCDLHPDTLAMLRELFHACDAARYAPVGDRQELAAIVPRLRTVLGDLETLGR